MRKEFTISVFTEDYIGLLGKVVQPFVRRHVNIESLTTSESSIKGIFRFTIVVTVEEEIVKKLVGQLDKQIDVLKAFYYGNEHLIFNELALYQVSKTIFENSDTVEQLIRKHYARILAIEKDYVVIEKTGRPEETQALLEALRPYGVSQFVRSGRVAVSKAMNNLDNYLKELDRAQLSE